jgi:putative ABC transport system permease protein
MTGFLSNNPIWLSTFQDSVKRVELEVTKIIDIEPLYLALGYLLLLLPLSLALWYRVSIVGNLLSATFRMTVQLLFVGLYLQVVFELDRWWLTTLWLVVMVTVADISVLRGAGLRLRHFFFRTFLGIFLGTAVPLAYFILVILQVPDLLAPQYVIPVGGMIMGNCLRANIIGIGRFYGAINEREGTYLHTLGQGATLHEATAPFKSKALNDALAPAMATMMTIGLVALPGMMTGILMAGVNPMAAIKYQIAIMISIFAGTAITVVAGIELTIGRGFDRWGVLREDLFQK